MLGDMSERQEKSFLAFMAKITSIKKLDNLLDAVVEELPLLVGAIGCWIYLEPEYLLGFRDSLVRGNKKYSEDEIFQAYDSFIVLAATNVESKKELLRKAFFGMGEGITGWVYKNGRTLRISDVRDQEELLSISNELRWANEYHDGDEFYALSLNEKRPLLVVPLILDGKPIGTLKFHATVDRKPYSEVSEKIATIAANIIAGILRQTWLISEQNETISRLIEMSNKNSYLDVISDVTNSLKTMLNCSRSEFYLKGESGETLHLIMRNGALQENNILFRRGQSLIGWVYKTGLSLVIDNIKKFMTRVRLDDDLLDEISNGHDKINDEDRYLVCEEDFSYYGATGKLPTLSFMAVPVKSVDGEVEGVLCGYWNNPSKMQVVSDPSQLILAFSFANTIALSLENKKQGDIGELLKDLGYITHSDQLFKTVVDKIPSLVSSSGCSIFELVQNRGKSQLKLRYTSRKSLIHSEATAPDIVYELGEGKTGICGYTRCVVIVNHFGSGELSDAKLNLEYERIKTAYPKDVVKIVLGANGKKVGLVQLQSDDVLSLPERLKFLAIANTISFDEKGLVSSKLEKYSADKTWSYIAVPIITDRKLLLIFVKSKSIN